MMVTDRVLKMDAGGGAFKERSLEDEGYGESMSSSGLVYNEGVGWEGTSFNTNLPVLKFTDGYYNIGTASERGPGETECVPGASQFQCQGTTTRRWAATVGGTEGYSSVEDIIKSMKLDLNKINETLQDPTIRQEFKDRQAGLKDETGTFIKDKYSNLHYPGEGSTTQEESALYNERYGAWHLKSLLVDSGQGSLLWENSTPGSFDYSSLSNNIGEFRIGDLITLTRQDKGDSYDQHVVPGYASEAGVSHVGMIVGQDERGVPIVEHSWTNNSGQHQTKREPLDSLNTHVPSSIIRYNKFDEVSNKFKIKPEATGTETVAGDGVEETKYKEFTSFKLPSKFENIRDLDTYLSGVGDLRGRLAGLSIYDSEGRDFAVLDITGQGYNFITSETGLWSSEAQDARTEAREKAERQEARAARIEERQGRRTVRKKKFVGMFKKKSDSADIVGEEQEAAPILRHGGLIYKSL